MFVTEEYYKLEEFEKLAEEETEKFYSKSTLRKSLETLAASAIPILAAGIIGSIDSLDKAIEAAQCVSRIMIPLGIMATGLMAGCDIYVKKSSKREEIHESAKNSKLKEIISTAKKMKRFNSLNRELLATAVVSGLFTGACYLTNGNHEFQPYAVFGAGFAAILFNKMRESRNLKPKIKRAERTAQLRWAANYSSEKDGWNNGYEFYENFYRKIFEDFQRQFSRAGYQSLKPQKSIDHYFSVLGTNQSEGYDASKKAYRQLALKYHPDLNPNEEAEAKFKEISEAWNFVEKHYGK